MQAAAKNLSSKPATTGSRAQHHMSIFDLNGDGKVDAEDFRIAAERAHLAGKEMSTFWYRAPIANLVYGLLDGDRPPSQENLKAVLNGYALVDALLLTIVMSMPMSMTFEEIELARLRFDGVVRFEFTDEIDYDRRYNDWKGVTGQEHGRGLRALDGRGGDVAGALALRGLHGARALRPRLERGAPPAPREPRVVALDALRARHHHHLHDARQCRIDVRVLLHDILQVARLLRGGPRPAEHVEPLRLRELVRLRGRPALCGNQNFTARSC